MKRLLLFAVSAFMAVPMLAQTEEDVTHLIANAGFDQDLTFQADGSMKEIVKNTTKIGRSFAWEAEDNTVYAHPDGTCDGKPRADGLWEKAVNGFIGQVSGWTIETNQDYPKCEWVYFGTIPYDLESQAIPIADNGTTFLETPSRPDVASGSDNVGFVYMRAGWGGRAVYKQTVDLPCAQYRLEYWAINVNPSGTNGKNLSKVTCRKDVWADETGFSDTEWTKHTIEFTPTADFTMEFGFESSGGSGSNPFLCIDGIKLYKIGEADEEELLSSDLSAAIGDINELITQASDLGLSGLVSEMSDCITEIDGEIGGTVESMTTALKKANADIAKFQQAIAQVDAIDAALAKIDNLLSTTNFPGLNDLMTKYEELTGSRGNGNAATLMGLVAQIEAAILAYYQSQTASEESPADWTYLVKNPWFIQPQYEPKGNAAEGYTYDVEDPSQYLTSDGWYMGSFTSGDQRTNYTQGLTCWNAWASGFTQTVSISQDLTGLPNGLYKVSADMITQAGYITNQHTFAKSTVQKSESPVMTIEGWDADGWETLTSDKVLVIDGKLTIGAEGTGNGNASAGWFCATNFKLWYLGEAAPGALDQVVNQTVADAKALAATMHFAADKAALEAAANAANSSDIESLTALSNAMDEAKASEAKYEEYMMDGKTLPTVAAALEGDEYGVAKEIVQYAYEQTYIWLTGSEATYKDIDARVNLLKNYVNTYVPAYNNAAAVAAASEGTAKTSIEELMAKQKEALMSEMKDAETVNAFVAELTAVIFDANKQLIWETEGATDYTAFIKNPNAEAEDGWTFNKGNGNTNTGGGQWFDGSGTRYFDSYNANGLVGYIATQLVTGLPNGTYTVGVYTRTPAEGAYVFTAPAEDGVKTFTEIPMNTWIDDEGVEQVASDTHGPIWEEAKAKIEGGLAEDDPTYAYYSSIYGANSGNGRGFQHQELVNVVVDNHQLLIGTATGSEELQTEKVFAGNWYSVGGWTLTLVELGNNEGWPGPLGEGEMNGDVNGDGSTDVADISSILTVMSGDTSKTSIEQADVNNDKTVDVADISAVLTIMASKSRRANF